MFTHVHLCTMCILSTCTYHDRNELFRSAGLLNILHRKLHSKNKYIHIHKSLMHIVYAEQIRQTGRALSGRLASFVPYIHMQAGLLCVQSPIIFSLAASTLLPPFTPTCCIFAVIIGPSFLINQHCVCLAALWQPRITCTYSGKAWAVLVSEQKYYPPQYPHRLT